MLLIDIAKPVDSKLKPIQPKTQRQLKDLEIDGSRMWELRTITIAAFGTIQRGFDQNVQLLPGHRSDIQLQKFTPMDTAYITSFVNCLG